MPRRSDARRQGARASRSAFGLGDSRDCSPPRAGVHPFPPTRGSSPGSVLQRAERWLPASAGMTAVAYRYLHLWQSLWLGRLALTFVRLCQAPPGMGRAVATFAGHAQIAPQVFQVAGASRGGFADLAVGDGHADADIQGSSPGKEEIAELVNERAVTHRRFQSPPASMCACR